MPATEPLLVSLAFVFVLLSKIFCKIRYEQPTIKIGSTDHGVKFIIYSSNNKAIHELLRSHALIREHMASVAALKDQLSKSQQALHDTKLNLHARLAASNLLLGETVSAQQKVESDMKVTAHEMQDRIHQLAGRQDALKRINDAVMEKNIALKTAKQDSVLSSLKLQEDFSRALKAKDATISELDSRAATLKQRIKSKEQEGWELQNQIQYKAKELHEMTLGWEATKTVLKTATDYADEIHSRLDTMSQQFEDCASKLQEKEWELKSWRKNTAGTIHALQSHISDLSCHYSGDLEVQQEDVRHMVTMNEESQERKAEKLQEDYQRVKTHLQVRIRNTTPGENIDGQQHKGVADSARALQDRIDECDSLYGDVCDEVVSISGSTEVGVEDDEDWVVIEDMEARHDTT